MAHILELLIPIEAAITKEAYQNITKKHITNKYPRNLKINCVRFNNCFSIAIIAEKISPKEEESKIVWMKSYISENTAVVAKRKVTFK